MYNLTKRFCDLVAVNNVNTKVRRNTLTLLMGSNGARKTTLLNGICGIATIHGSGVRLKQRHSRTLSS